MSDNLLKNDALSIWEDSKEKFQAPLSETSDLNVVFEVAINPRNLDSVSFAPLEGESISTAYEKVMKSISTRKDQHRLVLRKIYKEKLETAIFKDVIINKSFKKSPFIPFENKFSKKSPKKQITKLGRWETNQVIDYQTMNSLFNYFYCTFTLDPTNLKAGDIAIIILLRVWIASLGKGDDISTKDILIITSLDIDFQKKFLKIGKKEFAIPHWILRLLRCYCSQKKKQTRAHRLFKNHDIHGKSLERGFHQASLDILEPEAILISPNAISYLPHGYIGGRFPITELKAMRQVEPIIHF